MKKRGLILHVVEQALLTYQEGDSWARTMLSLGLRQGEGRRQRKCKGETEKGGLALAAGRGHQLRTKREDRPKEGEQPNFIHG